MPMTHDEIISYLSSAKVHGHTATMHVLHNGKSQNEQRQITAACEEVRDTCELINGSSFLRIDDERNVSCHLPCGIFPTSDLPQAVDDATVTAELKLRQRTWKCRKR